MSTFVTTSYLFSAQTGEQIADLRRALEALSEATKLKGLCLLGTEGYNLTVASPSPEARETLKVLLQTHFPEAVLTFKDSEAAKAPFREFSVKIKNEIVTIGRPGLVPPARQHHHLSPREWHQALQDPDTLVLDTRNDYEVEIGKFKTAKDFGIKEFRDFPERLKSSGIPKDQRVLIYCTGGIRCEKAILAMEEQGYQNVHQLDGGILNYLKEFPDGEFDGECFVFDYRVALTNELKPTSTYDLCPHCGQPAATEIQCHQCQTDAVICASCSQSGVSTCSKNCAHHARLGSASRKTHWPEWRKRHPTQA